MLFTGGMAMTMMDTAYVLSSLEVEGEAEVAAVVVAVVAAAVVVVVVAAAEEALWDPPGDGMVLRPDVLSIGLLCQVSVFLFACCS